MEMLSLLCTKLEKADHETINIDRLSNLYVTNIKVYDEKCIYPNKLFCVLLNYLQEWNNWIDFSLIDWLFEHISIWIDLVKTELRPNFNLMHTEITKFFCNVIILPQCSIQLFTFDCMCM